jgi:hypothetical protein
VRDGVLEAHPLGTGVRTPVDPSLTVIGAARFGERFETSAVPGSIGISQCLQFMQRSIADSLYRVNRRIFVLKILRLEYAFIHIAEVIRVPGG